jgi:hypothetical protein
MSDSPRTRLPQFVASLALLLVSGTASASPLFELIGAGVGTGGLNARTTGASAASTYFNPALLPRAKAGLELGAFVLNDAISITLDGRGAQHDIPEAAVDRFMNDLPSVPTTWLENGCDPDVGACIGQIDPQPRQGEGSSGNTTGYQVLGLVSHLWPRYLSLGIYAMVPYGSFTQAHSFFVDEREQFFTNSLHPELYSDRLSPVSLAFGAGSQVTDWLSLGVSLTLALKNTADAIAYSGNSAKLGETLQLSTQVDVAASVSPHFGVLLEPFAPLDISLTAHSPQKMEIGTAFTTYLPNGDIQRSVRPSVHAWMPWTAALGLNYEVWKGDASSLALTATGQLELWSEYLNRQSERPLKNYEWSDIFVPTAGVRYTHRAVFTAFLDGSFRPSPVPAQTGRTNYVDNDRYTASAGGTYDVPIERWDVTFRFGAQAQVHVLPERYQAKFDPTDAQFAGQSYSQLVVDEWKDDVINISTGEVIAEAKGLQTNNPGWPGFSSKGMLAGGGVSVSLLY